jgi:hypothetical protein
LPLSRCAGHGSLEYMKTAPRCDPALNPIVALLDVEFVFGFGFDQHASTGFLAGNTIRLDMHFKYLSAAMAVGVHALPAPAPRPAPVPEVCFIH